MANFYQRIADAAGRFPERIAVEWAGAAGLDRTSYAALLEKSARVSGWLGSPAGVGRADRVAILASNDAHWIAAYLGALAIGAVVVPLDTAYSAAQVQTILEDSGARVLFSGARHVDTARDAAARIAMNPPRVVLLPAAASDLTTSEVFAATPAAGPPVDVAAADAAVILYTSGTTADPKGVVLTHANLDAERAAAFQVVEVTDADVVLGVLPLFHALAQMANLLLPLSVGARIVFLEAVNSTTLVEALQTREITAFACVPQFFYLIHQRVMAEMARRGALSRRVVRALLAVNARLRDAVGWNPGRLIFSRAHHALGTKMRLLITGGSGFDARIARDLYGMGFELRNAYGLTETSGGATIVRAGDRFTTSVGHPFPGVEIRIAPGTSTPATADDDATADGEILIRGPIVMREYLHRPEATAEALPDGWLHTGDLGRLDADGRLYITGRKKEIIVLSSGKNLYPEEIEAHYRRSVFIKELAVIGLSRPGEPVGERLHAVIVPDDVAMRERGIVNVRELIRFELEGLSVELPAHKRILSYDISLEPLPRTTTGKLRRGEIERRARERASAPAVDRPLTASEREWLATGGHADLVAVVGEHVHRANVPPDANLELDLGLDSLERVELLTTLERRAGTRVAAEVRATLFTVRQLVEAVRSAPAGGPTMAAPAAGTELPWDAILAEPADAALVRHLTRSKLIRALVLFVLIRICRIGARLLVRYRVSGSDRVPATGAIIISPNHQTFLDGFFVAAALPFATFRRLFFVGAAEYFETPFMAWIARAINIVPVDPDANLVNAMQAAATGLRLGKALILFPEGERSIDGEIKTFRKGAAILASHLDAPIVPAALDGLFPLWPRGRRFLWRGLVPGETQVTLAFGAPFRVARGDYAAGTETLQTRVRGLFDSRRAGLQPRPESARPEGLASDNWRHVFSSPCLER